MRWLTRQWLRVAKMCRRDKRAGPYRGEDGWR